MWMGALGWDIVSTIFFDIRVIRETKWRSVFSACYSIAYLLSRYVSLAWLITAVTNSVIMTKSCDAWMKGSTALFSIGISATMCVFCLRTCSIWHMKRRVVWLVVSSWLLVTAFAVLLPIMSDGTRLPTSNFCSWHFNGLYMVGVFGALLLFDLLCLVLTVLKLNKSGWRGMMRGIVPSSRPNIDSEDVKTMLVQKTTAFFVIQFVFLVSALLVYVMTRDYAYKMMNIVASVAVASSMAGRIFRKAWRQTRELAPSNINRPPSYYPAWAEEHRSRPDLGDIHHMAPTPWTRAPNGSASPGALGLHHKRLARKQLDSLDFYVEGEFGPKPLSSAVSLRSGADRGHYSPRTAAQLYAAQQMHHLSVLDSGNAGGSPNRNQSTTSLETVQIRREQGSDNSYSTGVPSAFGTMDSGMYNRDYLERAGRFAEGHLDAVALGMRAFSNVPAGSPSRPAMVLRSPSRDELNPAPAYSRHGRETDSRSAEDTCSAGVNAIRHDSTTGSDRSRATSSNKRSRRGLPDGFNKRVGTAESQATSHTGSFLSFSTLEPPGSASGYREAESGVWGRRRSEPAVHSVQEESDNSSLESAAAEPEMEERRKRYIASPPMPAGARLSSKEESKRVYDFESVKAAAQLDHLPPITRSVRARPSTVSSAHTNRVEPFGATGAAHQPSGWGDQARNDSSESLAGRRSGETSSSRGQVTPRPKTAPVWPSPHLSPSDSVTSQRTLMPSQSSVIGLQLGHSSDSGSDPEESDALFAFRQTVDEDLRERNADPALMPPPPRSAGSRSGSGSRNRRDRDQALSEANEPSSCNGSPASTNSELRPRTSRGKGLSSFGKPRTPDAGGEVAEDGVEARPKSRHGTSKGRPRAPSSPAGRRLHSSASSSSRPASRMPTADGSASNSSGTRPSTAAGEDVKPFGFGILPHVGGPALPSTRAGTSASDEDEEVPAFGSVIQQQYAKLAAAAAMPLDPPEAFEHKGSPRLL